MLQRSMIWHRGHCLPWRHSVDLALLRLFYTCSDGLGQCSSAMSHPALKPRGATNMTTTQHMPSSSQLVCVCTWFQSCVLDTSYQEMTVKNTSSNEDPALFIIAPTGLCCWTPELTIMYSARGSHPFAPPDKAFTIPFSQLKLGPIIAHGGQAQVFNI